MLPEIMLHKLKMPWLPKIHLMKTKVINFSQLPSSLCKLKCKFVLMSWFKLKLTMNEISKLLCVALTLERFFHV